MEDRALRLGAGLTYYGLITLAPLLILLIGCAGLFVGEEAANVGHVGLPLSKGLVVARNAVVGTVRLEPRGDVR